MNKENGAVKGDSEGVGIGACIFLLFRDKKNNPILGAANDKTTVDCPTIDEKTYTSDYRSHFAGNSAGKATEIHERLF